MMWTFRKKMHNTLTEGLLEDLESITMTYTFQSDLAINKKIIKEKKLRRANSKSLTIE